MDWCFIFSQLVTRFTDRGIARNLEYPLNNRTGFSVADRTSFCNSSETNNPASGLCA